MNNQIKNIKKSAARQILQLLTLLVCFAFFTNASFAQQTAGGTVISNQASATYSDGTNSYSTVSNTVTVTVANVAGLAITPDGGSRPSVVAGQTGVLYGFVVTNTGNFTNKVQFLAAGSSVQVFGTGSSVTQAVIDVNKNGAIDAGDTDIFGNAANVNSADILASGTINVLVEVSVGATAAATSSVSVQLGDTTLGAPTYDNQLADNTANEVRTVTAGVNGQREARGDVSALVDLNATLKLNLTAPAGPLNAATTTPPAAGSDIDYAWELCNTGLRPASSITLLNAPAGSNSGVFIIVPIPVGTVLKTVPAGTLYTVSPLSTSPLAATYTTTAPAPLSTVTRVAFRVGALLTNGACSASVPMQVTITTTDATNDIYEIGDGFANNTINSLITDQSGDAVAGQGDGNANFDEPLQGGTPNSTQGIQLRTLLSRTGSVLIGPLGFPAAIGPTSNNDDYTNRSVNTGIAGVAPGGNTTAAGTIVYRNTVKNTGNANDTFTITAASIPTGFTVELSLDGTAYTTVTAGSGSISIPIAYNATGDIYVRVTAPSGKLVLTGYSVVINAASNRTPAAFNQTIDRLYTGAFEMIKSAVVNNATGVGAPNEAVPGAVIEYTISYRNVTSNGGTNNLVLTLSTIVITEDGNAAPNNWGTTTNQVVGSAIDSNGGVVTGDTAASTVLTDTISTLAPQASGTFKFNRTIR